MFSTVEVFLKGVPYFLQLPVEYREVPMSSLKIGGTLGSGSFGTVHKVSGGLCKAILGLVYCTCLNLDMKNVAVFPL